MHCRMIAKNGENWLLQEKQQEIGVIYILDTLAIKYLGKTKNLDAGINNRFRHLAFVSVHFCSLRVSERVIRKCFIFQPLIFPLD